MRIYGITRSWDSEKAARAFTRTHLYDWIVADDVDLDKANLIAEGYEEGWYNAIDQSHRADFGDTP